MESNDSCRLFCAKLCAVAIEMPLSYVYEILQGGLIEKGSFCHECNILCGRLLTGLTGIIIFNRRLKDYCVLKI